MCIFILAIWLVKVYLTATLTQTFDDGKIIQCLHWPCARLGIATGDSIQEGPYFQLNAICLRGFSTIFAGKEINAEEKSFGAVREMEAAFGAKND